MSGEPIAPHLDEEISAYLDGELDTAARARVEAALESSPAARRFLEELSPVERAVLRERLRRFRALAPEDQEALVERRFPGRTPEERRLILERFRGGAPAPEP